MKFYIKFIARGLIKITANITKGMCYLFHFLLPNKRFTLPRQSLPLLRSNKHSTIPRTLWQTNYTDRVTIAIYINYLFNRLMSPTWEYRFMDTEDREVFIREYYPGDVYNNYIKLQIGAAQADLWRVLVLFKYGGVYMDIDGHLVWPLGWTIKPEDNELYLTTKRDDITNYFIACNSGDENMHKISQTIVNNIKENKLKNVFELTGPGVFNKVLTRSEVNHDNYRYICNQGSFTNVYFQYIDKKQGKWTRAQEVIDIVKDDK